MEIANLTCLLASVACCCNIVMSCSCLVHLFDRQSFSCCSCLHTACMDSVYNAKHHSKKIKFYVIMKAWCMDIQFINHQDFNINNWQLTIHWVEFLHKNTIFPQLVQVKKLSTAAEVAACPSCCTTNRIRATKLAPK